MQELAGPDVAVIEDRDELAVTDVEQFSTWWEEYLHDHTQLKPTM